MAITNFVLLSLPAVGTVGLYEAYSPHCTVLIDAKSAGGCNSTSVLDVFGGLRSKSFVCAKEGPMLGFGAAPGFLPIYVDWGYAVVIAALLVFTLRRQVLSRVTGKPQPVGIAGTFTTFSLYRFYSPPPSHRNLSFFHIYNQNQ